MPQHTITLDPYQEEIFRQAAVTTGTSIAVLLGRAVTQAAVQIDAEVFGPIAALRMAGGNYRDAEGPFLIDQLVTPDFITLEPPPPMTRANLLKFQAQGVRLVNITFTMHGGARQADFGIEELLTPPEVLG